MKVIDVKIDSKEFIEQKVMTKADFSVVIERYKIQNPFKYEQKKEALFKQLAEFPDAPVEKVTENEKRLAVLEEKLAEKEKESDVNDTDTDTAVRGRGRPKKVDENITS